MVVVFKKSNSYDEDVPFTWRNYICDGKMLPCSPVVVDPNGCYISIHRHVVDPDGTVHGTSWAV